ncbi:MAG: divalent-cation tolerance protein CutA [Planctomycetota bacterium]
MELRWVYMTAKDQAEAEAIGKELVKRRLAACVNILPGMKSIYWWENVVEESQEVVLIAKTRATLMEPLLAAVRSLHGYQVPCVVSLPILEGNADYLRWLVAETISSPPEKSTTT